jgi:hypothetical protein
MTLHTSYDRDVDRYQVNDGRHFATDLTRDEYLAFQAEYISGRHTADDLFAHVQERHRRAINP